MYNFPLHGRRQRFNGGALKALKGTQGLAEGGGVWVVRSRPIPNMANPSNCLALKLYKLKFNCLQAAYNAAASTSFHCKMRLGNCSGLGFFTGFRTHDAQDSGLREVEHRLRTETPTIWLQAGKLMQSQALHAICNLHPSLSFKHSPPPNHPTTFHFAIAGKTMNFLSQQRRRARNPELIHIPVATIMTSSSRQ